MSRSEAAAIGGRARTAKLSKAQRAEIAQLGGRTASRNRPLEARRAKLDQRIRELVDHAPDLTPEQLSRLGTIFGAVSSETASLAVTRE